MTDWLSFDVIAHLWQSTLVIGVVWLMTLALRGNRADVRHRLWLAEQGRLTEGPWCPARSG